MVDKMAPRVLYDVDRFVREVEDLAGAGEVERAGDLISDRENYLLFPEKSWIMVLKCIPREQHYGQNAVTTVQNAIIQWPHSVAIFQMMKEIESADDEQSDKSGPRWVAEDYGELSRFALGACNFNIAESHHVWNRVLQQEEDTDSVIRRYKHRLSVPHLTIDDTFQNFERLIKEVDPQNYDELMTMAGSAVEECKKVLQPRRIFEDALVREATIDTFTRYLKWQTSQKVNDLEINLTLALFERATLKFPGHSPFWHDFFSYHFRIRPDDYSSRREICSRAVKCIPRDATTWAHYIRLYDSDSFHTKLDFFNNAICAVQDHDQVAKLWTALVTGEDHFLDISVLMKKQYQKYLKKKISMPYGFFKLLPHVLVNCEGYEAAQKWWKLGAKQFGAVAQYWLDYYEWELKCNAVLEKLRSLLKSACFAVRDLPDLIFDLALHFEVTSGSAYEYEKMDAVVRKARAALKPEPEVVVPAQSSAQVNSLKRPIEAEVEDHETNKRSKTTHTNEPKRDREHTGVIIDIDSPSIAEATITSHFKQFGEITHLSIFEAESTSTRTRALIEFSTELETAKALRDDEGTIEDHEYNISAAQDTVLFVTNFPADWSEQALHTYFAKFGEVLQVRLPSLRYDASRRFSYIQFLKASDTRSAIRADHGEMVVKVSDPSLRKAPEPRIFVKGLSWSWPESDIERYFSQFGELSSFRMPRTFNPDHHDGIAFITYMNHEDARVALLMDGEKVKGKVISVMYQKKSIDEVRSSRGDGDGTKGIEKERYLSLIGVPDTLSHALIQRFFDDKPISISSKPRGVLLEFKSSKEAGHAQLAKSGMTIESHAFTISGYDAVMKETITTMKPRKVRR